MTPKQESIHVSFIEEETVFRLVWAVDENGDQVAIEVERIDEPEDGSSPFIKLDEVAS